MWAGLTYSQVGKIKRERQGGWVGERGGGVQGWMRQKLCKNPSIWPLTPTHAPLHINYLEELYAFEVENDNMCNMK